jgi:sensitive to high expression protein 9
MGVNVLLFLVFQIGVEPWRRKRLVKGFEDKVMEALEKEGIASNVAIAALKEAQDARIEARHTPTETATFAEVEPPAVTGESLVEVKSEQVAPEPLVESKEEFATMNEIVPPSLLDRLRGYAEGYKASAAQLLSHEQVTVRRVDLTTVAFEGAFVGIAMTAIIGAILRS